MLIGISQRVVISSSTNERRDALDQAWVEFLLACNIEPVPIPNKHPDPVSFVKRIGVRGLILSGGGNISGSLGTLDNSLVKTPECDHDLSPERDQLETALLHASIIDDWPVVGVCRGMQALNLFHGGEIVKVKDHAGSKHAAITKSNVDCIDNYVFDAEVNSYHDFGIRPDGLGKGFHVLVEADGTVEAIIHKHIHHLGLMWHPERNKVFSTNDINLFKNFFDSQ